MPDKEELAAQRTERIEEMRNELVSEINRQVQAEHGVSEKAATEANMVFSRVDMDELAEAAYRCVEVQIMAAWHKAMTGLEADVDRLRQAIDEEATG